MRWMGDLCFAEGSIVFVWFEFMFAGCVRASREIINGRHRHRPIVYMGFGRPQMHETRHRDDRIFRVAPSNLIKRSITLYICCCNWCVHVALMHGHVRNA